MTEETKKFDRPFWTYDLDDVLTPEGAKELGHAIYRAWTGEEPPPEDERRKNDADNSAV